MFVACVIVCVLLAVLTLAIGTAQLNRATQAVAVFEHVGAAGLMGLSARLLLAAALGLVAGLVWAPLGIVTAACLIAYFLVAAGFHVKVGDPIGEALTPIAPAVMAVIALWLRTATA